MNKVIHLKCYFEFILPFCTIFILFCLIGFECKVFDNFACVVKVVHVSMQFNLIWDMF